MWPFWGQGLVCSCSVKTQVPGILNKPWLTHKKKYEHMSDSLTFISCHPFYPIGFSQFNRRHHCRRCGRLVCGSCSTKKMVVEGCRENPTRVCDQCYSYYNKEWVSCSKSDTVMDHCGFPRVLTVPFLSLCSIILHYTTEMFDLTCTLQCH